MNQETPGWEDPEVVGVRNACLYMFVVGVFLLGMAFDAVLSSIFK